MDTCHVIFMWGRNKWTFHQTNRTLTAFFLTPTPDTANGDASTGTLYYNRRWQTEPGNDVNMTEPKYLNAHYLHAVQPEAKIIISLRNPTERQDLVIV